MAPIQQPNFRPFARSGFRVCLFETPIKSVSSGQVSHSIAYALPAMAAVSASGFVAGARLARDAFRARRRAPEAPKVRFPRAQSADTSRRRGTDARFPNDKCQTRLQSRRAVTTATDARDARLSTRPADLERDPLDIVSDTSKRPALPRPRAQALPGPLVPRSPRRFGSASTTKTTPRAFAPWSNAHVKPEPSESWPQSAPAPAPPPPDRTALAALDAKAEEAREASERAQRELYDASARLKQTEAPLAEARQRHNEASRKVDELLVKLQVAEDALTRAEGNYDPTASANDAAVRAKHDAGAAMADLTREAKAAGEEASAARARLDEKRQVLRDAESREKIAVAAAAAAADEMDDADRALIDADAQFQRAHLRAVELGDQHAAARLVNDAPELVAAARDKARAAKDDVAKARAALDTASSVQLRALSRAESSIENAEKCGELCKFALSERHEAQTFYDAAVTYRDEKRASFRDAVDAASSVRQKAVSSQQNFAGSLERLYAARAQVSLAKSAVERAVFVMNDRASELELVQDEQDLAKAEKAMAERVDETSAFALREALEETSRTQHAVLAAESARDAEAAAEAAAAEARAARVAAEAAERDTKRIEQSWTLAAKLAEAEAAAVEGFAAPEEAAREAGMRFANEAARLARELDSAEAEAARERAAEEERLRVLQTMEAAKRNRAVGGGPANNAVPLVRATAASRSPPDADAADPVPVPAYARTWFDAEDTESDDDDSDGSVLTVSEWFS